MRLFFRPLPAALLLAVLWTVCRLAFLAHTGIPHPVIHDEFSYLLGADTFAHGRLANPTPAFAKFFESPQELVSPTYASKYPPGQAMFLAMGQVLFGSPFYGVILGNALMLFTFCLMLFAWVPPRWALAVSAMFAFILWPGMYWTNSYWGGSVAASGGALVLLAIGMYRTRQTPWEGGVFALGALLLFWTRPYEGGVFTVLVLIAFARELWQKRRAGVVLAAVSIFALGIAWTGYDNYAVTGNPFLLPHLLHQRKYIVMPIFWFERPNPEPTYSNPRLAAFQGENGLEMRTIYQPMNPRWKGLVHALIAAVRKFERPLRIAVLLTLLVPVAFRDPVYRKTCLVFGVFLLALAMETYQAQHYAAPIWAALALMIAAWAEHAWILRIRRLHVGAVLVTLILAAPAINAVSQDVVGAERRQQLSKSATSEISWSERRAALIRRLSALPKPQLVFVRYPSADWRIHEEWVFNSADIDHQRVVFAHDFGPEQDQALLQYYPDRTVWLLTFDPISGLEHLQPYSRTESP